MKKLDLSNIILSMGRSVDEAVAEIRRRDLACELEEFECTVTFETEMDSDATGIDEKTNQIKGLRFFEIRERLAEGRPKREPETEPESARGSLTCRAIFAPHLRD